MVDAIFSEPRLAAVYDALDPDRSDLEVYERIVVDELGARSVLDIGCGTGTFALMLAARGLAVTGVDPASASIDVARAKPGADAVRWLEGTLDAVEADASTGSGFDVATMTANVAQVFVDERDWASTLGAARRLLRPGGTLVLESRLRFRSREAIESSFETAGFWLADVRDAPDRPGREWVFLARRAD